MFSVFCTVCSKSFRIDSGGKSQARIHGQGMFHIQHVKAQKGQGTFAKSAKEDSLVMSEASSSLSMEEQVLSAETIQALKCVDSNLSFASTNGDRGRFWAMFPDSKIAKSIARMRQK